MTASVESYFGEKAAKKGVKPDEMARITDIICALVARFPLEFERLNKMAFAY